MARGRRRKRESFSWEVKEEEKVKASLLREDPCSPFYQTRGASYIDTVGQVKRECA
jgi:hypothetical protein